MDARKQRSDKGKPKGRRFASRVAYAHIQARLNGRVAPDIQTAAEYYLHLKQLREEQRNNLLRDVPDTEFEQSVASEIITDALNALHEKQDAAWLAPSSGEGQLTTEIYIVMRDVALLLQELRNGGGVFLSDTHEESISRFSAVLEEAAERRDSTQSMYSVQTIAPLGGFYEDDEDED